MTMIHNWPDRVAMLEKKILRLYVERDGAKLGLHDGASRDIVERIRDGFHVDPDTGALVSRSGESLTDTLVRLRHEPSSKHLFAHGKAADNGARQTDELAKLSPEQRLEFANANFTPKRK